VSTARQGYRATLVDAQLPQTADVFLDTPAALSARHRAAARRVMHFVAYDTVRESLCRCIVAYTPVKLAAKPETAGQL
jgi:hypothetical protein